jgi:N-acetylmuramoyl-L-alanine amidase
VKKIYINPGHSDKDPGAVGYETERKLNVNVTEHMIEYLLANYECEVRSNPGTMDSLAEICADANSWGANLFVSNHFNAGKGDGYEALVYSQKNVEMGKIFAKHVVAIGQNLRLYGAAPGVKIRPDLAVLKNTNMPAVLNEGAFVDNLKDIQDWNDDAELKALGIAYAKAAAEFLELPKKPVQKPKKYYVRCTMNVGPFAKKETANSLVIALKSAGADVNISEE